MKTVYFVEEKAAFSEDEGLDMFDFYMYHGLIDECLPIDDNNLGDKLENRIHLYRNAYKIPGVFKPSRNLIVSKSVMQEFEEIANVDFFQVVFKRLFYLNFDQRRSLDLPADFYEMEEYVRSLGDDPNLRDKVEPYYELIIPSYDKVKQEFEDLDAFKVRELAWDGIVSIDLSASLFERYPVMWTSNGIAMTDEVLQILKPGMVTSFFNIERLNV